ncbi:MAG: LysR substrate-binding domain-containing protein [Rhodospirillales bacterium]|nr:LysR substrate-binding domain-containing protein [Rhodospirillales bacterium]MDH3912612.1 LysR substrate-binding domain-containing protein [Rhodospirillales bacterium]MDH3920175.1 LysR substrate-binding domain-containing protein [Rhodospirillales bacterium]MDH3969311.1 LysR substrate-binding domain-containing protein [Rhodospirillales bacterium]
MDLKWLEDFVSLARTGNFSKSAAERNVTQSAFSRRIKSLEFWLGVPLVDRSTYPTSLTEAGLAFRDVAEALLRRLYEERDQLRGIHRSSQDVVSFSAMHTLSLTFYPKWLRQMESKVGAIESRLKADNIHNCVQLLIDGACDFLLCFAHPAIPLFIDSKHYPHVVLGEDRLVPVSAAGHAGRPLHSLTGRAARPIPYLAYAPESLLGRAVELVLDRNPGKALVHRCYENSMAESLKAMALEEHGLAWLPESSIRAELRHKRLVRAGGAAWELPLEIRVYRSAERNGARAEELWSALSSTQPTGRSATRRRPK